VQLRPAALDDFGLPAALTRLAATVSEQSGTQVDLEAHLGEQRLAGEVETTLYRIVQEALTNVVKHAEATRASVTLTRKPGSVVAVVEDDGRGFDVAAANGGLGLIGMRERLAVVGGRLSIEASPGSGTTLVAEVPLR
jgi:signal transduction histidine kinase